MLELKKTLLLEKDPRASIYIYCFSFLFLSSRLTDIMIRGRATGNQNISLQWRFESVDQTLNFDHQMKAIEKYLPVVLFVTLYKVVLTFEAGNEVHPKI